MNTIYSKTDPAEIKLLQTLDRDRLIKRCIQLVKTPTVSPYSGDSSPAGEGAGQIIVADELRILGANVEEVPCDDSAFDRAGVLAPHGRKTEGRPNIVATFTLGTGHGPTVALDAHMDTVAVDAYDGEPFSGHNDGEFIHGRGSSDDKSSVAAMIEAATAILSSGNNYNGKLILCSVTDEECDGAGRGSLSCVEYIPRPDAAIVMDGSSCGIWNGCTGVITAQVQVEGRAGHAAMGNTVNAVEQAITLMPAFQRFRKERGDRPGDFNLGLFQAGDHPANVPRLATLAMNIKTSLADMENARRQYGTDSGRTVREFFEKCVGECAAQDAFFQEHPPQVSWRKDVPAAQCGAESATLLDTTSAAWQEVRGEAPLIELLAGWGDIAHFLRAGIPAIGLGCGYPGAAHSAREKVRIQDMLDTARIVSLTLHRLLA